MKVTKVLVKRFEEDQKSHGTQTAIYNVLWLVADELFRDLGVKKVTTSHKKGK